MIKFSATGEGVILVGLGITAENVDRLRNGQPIRVRLSDMGFAGTVGSVEIGIFFGETEADLVRDLRPFVSDDTIIRDDRGRRS